nr:unnamed protein product [Digitaria exilis]
MKVLERWNYVAPLAEGSPEEQKRFDACQIPRGRMMHYCNEPHVPVVFSSRAAKELRRVVMLSWPCCRNRTAVEGNVSHRGRDMDDISLQNPFNLTTKMAEVDITSDVGSSGFEEYADE